MTISLVIAPILGTHLENFREHKLTPTPTQIIIILIKTLNQRLTCGKNICPRISDIAIYIAGSHIGIAIQ